MEYIEVRGKTIEIAIALGLEELHLRDVSEARVEVLQQAERGFLGMGGRDAVVRLTRKEETPGRSRRRGGRGRGQGSGSGAGGRSPAGEAATSTQAHSAGGQPGRTGGQQRSGQRAQAGGGRARAPEGAARAGGRPSAARPAPRAESPRAEEAGGGSEPPEPARTTPAPARTEGDADQARRRRRRGGRGRGGAGSGDRGGVRQATRHEEDEGPPHSAEYAESLDEKAEVAHDFLSGLLDAFDLSATVSAAGNEDAAAVEVTIEGEPGHLQILIGRQGTVLQAIQDLTRTVVQRRMQSATRIRLDVAGYRERRKAKLEAFATEQALLALQSGREIELDPMSSPDRKVVHDTIANIEGVETYSEGEEPDRYVVLTPTGPPQQTQEEPEPAPAAAAGDDAPADEDPVEPEPEDEPGGTGPGGDSADADDDEPEPGGDSADPDDDEPEPGGGV